MPQLYNHAYQKSGDQESMENITYSSFSVDDRWIVDVRNGKTYPGNKYLERAILLREKFDSDKKKKKRGPK
jgi:hypothetical protein